MIHTKKVAPAPQKRPITVALFQAYLFPPNCKAKKHCTDDGAKSANPTRSNSENGLRRTVFQPGLAIWSGMWRSRKKKAAAPPTGRLM